MATDDFGYVLLVGKKVIPIEPLSTVSAGMLEQMSMFGETLTGSLSGRILKLEGLEIARLRKRWWLHPRGKFECTVSKEMRR